MMTQKERASVSIQNESETVSSLSTMRTAMQQALEALEYREEFNETTEYDVTAITALRDVLAEKAEQEPLMITPGGGAFPIIEVDYVGEFAEPIRSSVVPLDWSATFTPVQQEPISTDWTPPNYTNEQWQKLDQEYQDHVAEQAEQKPVAIEELAWEKYCEDTAGDMDVRDFWEELPKSVQQQYIAKVSCSYPNCNCPFDHPGGDWCAKGLSTNATPVRTKDLTDIDLWKLWEKSESNIDFARAVIAADREKNNANNNT